MLTDTLKALYKRDLDKLIWEMEAFSKEDLLWQVPEGITNSSGNLCLHLVGNLNHFIGAQLGGTGYVRQRELEFSQKDVPLAEMKKMVTDTIEMIAETLDKLSAADLDQDYPIVLWGKPMSTEFFLVHLAGHVDYHLGQVNHIRRILDA